MRRPGGEDDDEEKFVWVKKQKLDELRGLSPAELERRDADRRERNRRELEKLERQRLQWESEKEQKQRERETTQFGRETEMLGDWQEKERRFHLDQALAKADLRVKAGRGSLLDWLVINTTHDEDINLVFVGDPIDLIAGEDEGLDTALEEHRELERDPDSLNYLDALLSYLHRGSPDVNESHQLQVVKEDVCALLEGKDVAALTKLERSVQAKISGPGPIDTEYWRDLLEELHRFRRRALVRECNSLLVERRKGQLGERALCLTLEDRRVGGTTPVVGDVSEFPATPSPVATHEDALNWDPSPESVALYHQEASRKVSKDEIPFNTEAEDLVESRSDHFVAQHALVRPRYFNRVRTCYEWNKYNQTHFDTDNPPPKTIQGYRFNIFYPQLASHVAGAKSTPPTYQLETDPHDPEMQVIRFRAGPPYEDVLFRIQADDWDMSHRQGFKCSFEGGALRLHFWFKSQRYKR